MCRCFLRVVFADIFCVWYVQMFSVCYMYRCFCECFVRRCFLCVVYADVFSVWCMQMLFLCGVYRCFLCMWYMQMFSCVQMFSVCGTCRCFLCAVCADVFFVKQSTPNTVSHEYKVVCFCNHGLIISPIP